MKSDLIDKILDSFVDSEENEYYVPLDGSRINYSKLTNSLNNPFKIILLFGPPGSGKSFLFQKFYNEYNQKKHMALFKTPTFDLEALYEIYENITGETLEHDLSQNKILKAFRNNVKDEVIIMLDEAQLYSVEQMEWIRILSNEANLKFIISVHKVGKEEVLAQQHFQTRIFETIEMDNISKDDIKTYIDQKLILAEGDFFLTFFSKKEYKTIYKITKGNLRNINRLLHRFFTLYKFQFEKSKLSTMKDTKKYIEMAALDLDMLSKKKWLKRWF